MRPHLKHLAMCAPMLLIAVVAVASGAGAGFLLIAAMCVLMMAAMMATMGHGDHGSQDPPR